jgi:hypothetical protein
VNGDGGAELKRISDISDQISGGGKKRKAYTEFTEDAGFAEKRKRKAVKE